MSDNYKKDNWRPPYNPDYVPPPKVSRPKFSIIAVILDFFIPYILFAAGCYKMLGGFPNRALVWISVFYFTLRLKRLLLWFILLYQRFAAERIRAACSFTPSCSEYMFLSINKYGVLPGIVKGIGRILRCRGENNGEDYP